MLVTGQEAIAKNIIKYTAGFLKSTNRVMGEVSAMLDAKVTANMSLTDHSLKDLRDLGHPYAKRHGEKGSSVHAPYYQVHQQSGRLLESKSKGTIPAVVENGTLKATAYVMLDANSVPYANSVIFGTSKMIPRPVLEGSKLEVANDAYKHIATTLKGLRLLQ